MNRLLVMGAGGHGKVVAETAIASGQWTAIAYLDGRFPALSQVLNWPVIGRDTEAIRLLADYPSIFVAIGDNRLRLDRIKALESGRFALPVLVHPKSWISPSARIGEGTVVVGGAIVNAAAALGRACIVNTGATIDHDCVIGNGVHVSPGAHIGGDAVIGDRTWIGIGASVRHGVRIGADVMIGAGAAVVTDVPDGMTMVGVPAVPKGA